MSAEQRWADRQEWAQERGEIEIKIRFPHGEGETCSVRKCGADAVARYQIGPVAAHGDVMDIYVCADHDSDDTAFDLYNREVSRG